MNRIVALLVVLGASNASAQRIPASPTPARAILQPSRDLALEQAISARRQRIGSALTATSRASLDSIGGGLLATIASSSRKVDASAITRERVQSRFSGASAEQIDMLTLYVLGGVASQLGASAASGATGNGREELSSLKLQSMMDSRSQMMAMLSNILKKVANTGESVVTNLK